MSKLKKLVLLMIVLVMILPIFVCLYIALLFGNSVAGIQWLSAFILCGSGFFNNGNGWCDGMSKIGICLGGVENGKMIYCNDEFYYALVGDIVNYRKVDLKFIKEIRQSHFQKSYVLNQPFNIYVPEKEYYKYEGALKFILSKWMESEWEKL